MNAKLRRANPAAAISKPFASPSGQRAPRSSEFFALAGGTFRGGDRLVFPRTNWTVCADQQWAVLGPNGAGKSLFARALTGHAVPVTGDLRWTFAGEASPEALVTLVSPHTHREVLAQESSFYQSRWHSGLAEGEFTVRRFLSQDAVEGINPFEVKARRCDREVFARHRHEAVRLLGIAPLLARKLIHLSNGEMRKVLLARALARRPRWLLLDEPFTGLDVTTRRRLQRMIAQLMRRGLKVLVVTSRPDEVPAAATHLLLIERHRVVAQGHRATMLRHPLTLGLSADAAARSAGTVDPPQAGAAKAQRRGGGKTPPAWHRSPNATALVEFRNVTVRYGAKRILRNVTWALRRGERWVLLGPNGSGKTTFLSLIQGDNPQAYAQDIRLFERSLETTRALWLARRRLGWLSPELHLHHPTGWSCLEVVCSGFAGSIGLHEAVSLRRQRTARGWLRRLGLDGRAEAALEELSLGDQRLVLLARAVVRRPELLVLDEPCQGLDRRHRHLVLGAVDAVVRETDASLLFVTHHRRELPACVTRELRLRQGQAFARRWAGGASATPG